MLANEDSALFVRFSEQKSFPTIKHLRAERYLNLTNDIKYIKLRFVRLNIHFGGDTFE